jgi:hypothetical protein
LIQFLSESFLQTFSSSFRLKKSSPDSNSSLKPQLHFQTLISGGSIFLSQHSTAGNHSRIGTHSGATHLKIQFSLFHILLFQFKTPIEIFFVLSKLFIDIISLYGLGVFILGSILTYIFCEFQ